MQAVHSVFKQYEPQGFPYVFQGKLHCDVIAGGTPTNPDVAEGWLRSKIADKDMLIAAAVTEVMAERGVDAETAVEEVAKNRHLTGFKRDDEGLYIEGRQLKACLKEAAAVALAADKLPARWGKTHKGIVGFTAEHIFVRENKIHLGVTEPTDVLQSFVHTFRGSGIQYTEHVTDVDLEFTVETDYDFAEKEWAMLWLTAERQGLGASRSQGYGRFVTVEWEPVKLGRSHQTRKAA